MWFSVGSPLTRILCSHARLIRGVLIGDLRAQAVTLFADDEQQPNVNPFPPQSFRGRDLRGDNALGIARPAPINARRIFRRSV